MVYAPSAVDTDHEYAAAPAAVGEVTWTVVEPVAPSASVSTGAVADAVHPAGTASASVNDDAPHPDPLLPTVRA